MHHVGQTWLGDQAPSAPRTCQQPPGRAATAEIQCLLATLVG